MKLSLLRDMLCQISNGNQLVKCAKSGGLGSSSRRQENVMAGKDNTSGKRQLDQNRDGMDTIRRQEKTGRTNAEMGQGVARIETGLVADDGGAVEAGQKSRSNETLDKRNK